MKTKGKINGTEVEITWTIGDEEENHGTFEKVYSACGIDENGVEWIASAWTFDNGETYEFKDVEIA